MPHVITTLCQRNGDCVDVCPVEAIAPGPRDHPEWPQFYIDPDLCIDCGACEAACPVEAIFPEEDLPDEHAGSAKTNSQFFTKGPGHWSFDLRAERAK